MASDLISRKELIDKMNAFARRNFGLDGRFEYQLQGMEIALNFIEEASAVEPMKWIPCSERKPGFDEDGTAPILRPTLVTTRNKKGGLNVQSSYFETFYGRWLCEAENRGIEVIAWMPLPEPYKDGDIDG